MKILVVEDEKTTSFLVKRILTKLGYQVSCCENGDVALKTWEEDKDYSLIFLDWHIEGISGPELIKKIRSKSSNPLEPYIVMMTYTQNPEVVHTAFQVGANDYVPKPIRAADVWARVKTHMAIAKLSDNVAAPGAQSIQVESQQFLAEIIHEITNPLSNLAFKAENLKSVWQNRDETKFHGECDKLVDGLIGIGQIVRGHFNRCSEGVTEKTRVNLNLVIEEAIDSLSHRYKREGVSCHFLNQGGESHFINGNMRDLVQVLSNLINNACDAIKSQSEPWINIALKPGGEEGSVFVEVEDSGSLLKAHEGVFGVELQGHSLKNVQNLGFGLRLVREILKDHGSELMMSSENQNTKFYFELPRG